MNLQVDVNQIQKSKMKYFIGFIILLMFESCFMNSHTEKKIIEPYYLIAADTENQMTISKRVNESSFIGVVQSTVIEYTIIENYIIAKSKKYDVRSNTFSQNLIFTTVNLNNGQTRIYLTEKELLAIIKPIKKIKWIKTF